MTRRIFVIGLHTLRAVAVAAIVFGAVQVATASGNTCQQLIKQTGGMTGPQTTQPGDCFGSCDPGAGHCAAISGSIGGHAVNGCGCSELFATGGYPCWLAWKHQGALPDTWTYDPDPYPIPTTAGATCYTMPGCARPCTEIRWEPLPPYQNVTYALGCDCP